jgi:hypothetical protein
MIQQTRKPHARTFPGQADWLETHEHPHAATEYTKKDLMHLAAARGIEGRSKMNKDELIAALVEQTWGPATIAAKEHHTRTHTAWDDFRASKLKSYIDTQKAAGAANHKAAFAAAMAKISNQYRATPDFGARAKKVIRPGMTAKGYAAEISRLVNKYRDQQGGAKKAPAQIYGEGKEFKNRRARALAQYRAGVAAAPVMQQIMAQQQVQQQM